MGNIAMLGCSRRVQRGYEALHDGVMLCCESRAAWQTSGATPLLIASEKGHVDCVQALLGGSAAINQAMVGSTSSMTRPRGVCVLRGSRGACVHAWGCSWLGALGWHTLEGLAER